MWNFWRIPASKQPKDCLFIVRLRTKKKRKKQTPARESQKWWGPKIIAPNKNQTKTLGLPPIFSQRIRMITLHFRGDGADVSDFRAFFTTELGGESWVCKSWASLNRFIHPKVHSKKCVHEVRSHVFPSHVEPLGKNGFGEGRSVGLRNQHGGPK